MIRLPRREWLFLLAASLVLFASAAPWIGNLGLEYDEAHFVETATRIVARHPETTLWPDGFYLDGRPFPFMTMPYIGALDGWLLAIPIGLFGFDPLVPRIANTLAGCALLLVAYLFARRFGGPRAGMAVVALLLCDLEFLLHVPTHYGPFLLQCACGALVWLFLDRWLESARSRDFYAACFFAGIAFQEKLTFAWILALISAVFLFFRGREILRLLRVRTFATGAAIFLAAMLPVLIYAIGRPEVVFGYGSSAAHSPTWAVLHDRLAMFYATLAGQELMRQQLDTVDILRVSLLPLLFVAGAVLAVVIRHRTSLMLYAFTFGLVLLQVLFSEGGRLHHYLLAYPLLQTAIALPFLSRRVWPKILVAAIGITAISTAHNLVWYSGAVARTGGVGHWSSHVEEVAEWIREHSGQSVFATSWGLYRPLYFLTGARSPVHDRSYALRNEVVNADDQEDLNLQLERRNALWITSAIYPEYESNLRRLFRLARDKQLSPHLVREFRDHCGRRLYWVHSFHRYSAPPWRADIAEASGALRAEVPLPPGTTEVSFQLPARRWRRAETVRVEFLDDSGKRIAAWWRSATHQQFPWPEQRFEFGPGLMPDYFIPLPGAAPGVPTKLIVRVESAGDRPVDVRITGLQTR